MISKLVLFSFYFNCVLCSLTHYKASIADMSKTDAGTYKYESVILEAAAANVDLLVLSPRKLATETSDACVTNIENYDEVVKIISRAARTVGIYVVAPVYEKTRCGYRDETIFNNMVFDRDGGIIAAYRTPVSIASKCNTTESKAVKFTTDFGVIFALVTEEDIILHRIKYFDGVKNFIVSGVASNIPHLFDLPVFLANTIIQETSQSYNFVFSVETDLTNYKSISIKEGEQFTSSWSFVNNVNVLSPSGLFGANMVNMDNLIVAEFQKSGGSSSLITTSSSNEGLYFLHQNTKLLNTEVSLQENTDTVCEGSLCCNFYLKMSDMDSSVPYTLSAHSDIVHVSQRHVALQACAISPKLHKDVKFDKITITANFTKDSAQFPFVTTMEPSIINNLILKNNFAELYDTNVLSFGVVSRDYTNDDVIETQNKTNTASKYISYENVNDFFDYVWIRVRVPIFIVSIYILEMM